MKLFHGKVCPVCEIGKLEICQEDVEFEYKRVKTVIPRRTVFTCQECEESFFDPKEQREIDKLLIDERRKIDGLHELEKGRHRRMNRSGLSLLSP